MWFIFVHFFKVDANSDKRIYFSGKISIPLEFEDLIKSTSPCPEIASLRLARTTHATLSMRPAAICGCWCVNMNSKNPCKWAIVACATS